jgi:uncharacterized protein (TIGR03435 family)
MTTLYASAQQSQDWGRTHSEARRAYARKRCLHDLNPDQRILVNQRMLQALLADRFKLTLHGETMEGPVYALVIGKNGPKLKESKPGDAYTNGLKVLDGRGGAGMLLIQGGGGSLTGQAVSIQSLAHLLSQQLGRNVLDKTGLTGNYDFTLKWTPDDSQPPMGGQQGTENVHPRRIFLGLRSSRQFRRSLG